MTPSTVLTCASGLALAWLTATASARACTCAPLPSALEARDAATAVFEGRVSAVQAPAAGGPDADGATHVAVAVVRTWKGLVNSETVRVRTRDASASCRYMFEPHVSYLVYASGSGSELEVSRCSRTRALSDAAEDLALLGAGVTPVAISAGSPPAAPTKAAPKTAGCSGFTAAANGSTALVLVPAAGLVRGARRRKIPR